MRCRLNTRTAAPPSSRCDRSRCSGRCGAGARRCGRRLLRGHRLHPREVAALFAAAKRHGLPVKPHAEQLSDLQGAALAADSDALSADHLEHVGEEGVAAMARARHRRRAAARRLLFAAGNPAGRPSSCCAATVCRWRWRPTAIPAPRRALADSDDVHGLHSVRPDPGGGARRNDPRCRPGLGSAGRGGTISPAKPPTSASGASPSGRAFLLDRSPGAGASDCGGGGYHRRESVRASAEFS